jgi:hypothetical protein
MIYPFDVIRVANDRGRDWGVTIKLTRTMGHDSSEAGDRYRYPSIEEMTLHYTVEADTEPEAIEKVAQIVAR